MAAKFEPRVFATGLGFVEGPAWTPAGELRLVSLSHGCVCTLSAAGETLGKIITGGGPNGLALGGDAAFVAQNGGIFAASGKVPAGVQRICGEEVALLFPDAFEAPNDLCFGPDGLLYVTDPSSDRALTEPTPGRLVACDLETEQTRVVAAGRLFPNGLAFDPTGSHLYLAQTYPRLIERFTFRDGALSTDGIFCELANGRPDGIAIDIEGNLWVCTPGTGGLEVFSADGRPIRRFEFGAGTMTTNCCFGGPDMRQLFVTAAGQGAVLVLDVETPGLPLRSGAGRVRAHPFSQRSCSSAR